MQRDTCLEWYTCEFWKTTSGVCPCFYLDRVFLLFFVLHMPSYLAKKFLGFLQFPMPIWAQEHWDYGHLLLCLALQGRWETELITLMWQALYPLNQFPSSSVLLILPIEHQWGNFSVQVFVRKSQPRVSFHRTIDPSFWCPRIAIHSEIISHLFDSPPLSQISEVRTIYNSKTFPAYSCSCPCCVTLPGERGASIYSSQRTLMIGQRHDATLAYINKVMISL